ncbi:IclR family transcriptional regulator [Aliamphritea spongicola]|uniref:IclR family transcriptional regulator n=1 Tax=Aliamphritea spongicola TaxID=707589 RepID=UPI00196B12B0|nr:IclR family transcriptional regulator [Aliamphritea spongicola]MBN3562319.1 IclR family transcriptional regulator [Aliamphritea spongicola]
MTQATGSKAPAIDHSVQILDLLTASAYPLTLSEICEATGISPASGHRIINAMLSHQLIARDPARKKAYCIGSKIFQISSSIYSKQSLIAFFHPIAEILKNEIHKTIFLSIPVGDQAVVVSKVESSLSQAWNIFTGQTIPLQQSAAGKAILAMQSGHFRDNLTHNLQCSHTELTELQDDLQRAQRLGYAVSHGETDSEISCIAAPVLNLRNEPVAAISAAISGAHLNPQDARDYSKKLIQAARQLSARIV